jgi:hypothetical protein
VLTVAVVAFDTLLHGYCARQGCGCRGEHHHETVTEVLHLGASGLRNRLAQDREVLPADLVGGFREQTLRQLGRSHDVREQDRHVLGGHPALPSADAAESYAVIGLMFQGAAGVGLR